MRKKITIAAALLALRFWEEVAPPVVGVGDAITLTSFVGPDRFTSRVPGPFRLDAVVGPDLLTEALPSAFRIQYRSGPDYWP